MNPLLPARTGTGRAKAARAQASAGLDGGLDGGTGAGLESLRMTESDAPPAPRPWPHAPSRKCPQELVEPQGVALALEERREGGRGS